MDNNSETTATTKTRNRSFNIYQTEIRTKKRQSGSLNNFGWTVERCNAIRKLLDLIFALDDSSKTLKGDKNEKVLELWA